MKNVFKVLALIVAIGLSVTSCGGGDSPSNGGGGGTDNGGGGTDNGGGNKTLSGEVVINPSTGAKTHSALTATYNGTEEVSYQWKKDGATVGVNSNSYTPTAIGTYKVTVSADGYDDKASNEVIVTAASLSGSVTVNPNGTVLINTKLTAQYDGTEAVSYQWSKDGANIGGASGNEYTPTAIGTYKVTVSADGYLDEESDGITVIQLEANQHLVTFDLNGGNIDGNESDVGVVVTDGEAATAPSNVVRTGYAFNQWDKTFTNVTGNLTVTAQWNPITYSISYNANGGSGAAMANSAHTYDVAKNLSSNTYSPPTDKQFAGWNTQADGSGTSYYNGQSVKNLSSVNGTTITFYAKWVESSNDQDFYYGVASSGALNYLKGTATAPAPWNTMNRSPTATNTSYTLGSINKNVTQTVPLLGNGIAFLLLPASFENAIIEQVGSVDVTSTFDLYNVTYDGKQWLLYQDKGGVNSVNYNLYVRY